MPNGNGQRPEWGTVGFDVTGFSAPRFPRPQQGLTRRELLTRAFWSAIGTSAALEGIYAVFASLPDYFNFNSETPRSTTVIPQLQINLAGGLNIRNSAGMAEAGNDQQAPNTVRVDTLGAVGRKSDGSGQLVPFDKNNPIVTLQNVPVLRGYNPDTGQNDKSGLWAAIPARFQEGLFFPGILDLKKDGWIYVSISHQTDGLVKVPNDQFQNVQMSPKDPRAGVITKATK